MGYIYLITNYTNGKRYVGQTVNPIHHRWKEHIEDSYNGNKSNSLLHRAIIRDGESNFGIEVIEECGNELLNDREKMYIQVYDTFYTRERGYNMTWGGEGHTTYSDEEITYLWNQGYRNCEIAKLLKATENTISLRIRALFGEEAAQSRRADSKKIAVLQYDLYGNFVQEWDSGSEAEKSLGLSTGSVSRCCNKQRTNSGDFLWKKNDDDTPIEELMLAYARSQKCCKVDLINKDSAVIKTYESGKAAERDLGIARGKVSEVCNNKYGRKTANGYRFQWNYRLKREIVNGIK